MCIPTSEKDGFSDLNMLLKDQRENSQDMSEIMNITLLSFESLKNSMVECTKALASMEKSFAVQRKKDLIYVPLILFSAAVTGAFLGLRKT